MLLGLAQPLVGCQEDLGDPVIRSADWDAQPPGTDGGSATALSLWQPACGPDAYYACPPYGLKRGDIIENKFLASGNAQSDSWANAEGIFSLADYYQSDAELLFVFYGQDG